MPHITNTNTVRKTVDCQLGLVDYDAENPDRSAHGWFHIKGKVRWPGVTEEMFEIEIEDGDSAFVPVACVKRFKNVKMKEPLTWATMCLEDLKAEMLQMLSYGQPGDYPESEFISKIVVNVDDDIARLAREIAKKGGFNPATQE